MRVTLTDDMIAALEPPMKGRRIVWDAGVPGLGIRISKDNQKSFVLSYRNRKDGTQRLYRIGKVKGSNGGVWTLAAARTRARALRKQVDLGGDPQGEIQATREAVAAERAAPDMNALADRYLTEWAEKRKRPISVKEDKSLLMQWIRPRLGKRKVAEVTRKHILELHDEITHKHGTPGRANLTLTLLSKMFNLAIEWEWRIDNKNPVKGVARNASNARERYLSIDAPKGEQSELQRLLAAMAKLGDRDGANAVLLLLHTGSRRGEVLRATWDQFDLQAGRWTKPAAATKQKKEQVLYLSPQALTLITQMRADADNGEKRAVMFERAAEKEKDRLRKQALLNQAQLARTQRVSPYLFPSARKPGQPLEGLRVIWRDVCRAAGITGLRLHDLRHSYASFLRLKGHDLHVVGHMLGHSQLQTSARYSHVMPRVAQAAAAEVGSVIAAAEKGTKAQVIRFKKNR